MEVKKVGVIGLGMMGAGIAQVTAQAGYQTVVHDVSGEIIEKAIEGIDRALSRLSEKGRISKEEKTDTMGRLVTGTGIETFGTCDLVIEAVGRLGVLRSQKRPGFLRMV